MDADATKLRDSKVKEAAEGAASNVSLGKLASAITSGSRGWAEYYASEGPVFVRITNLQRGNITLDWSDIQHVSPPKTKETERTRIQGGDLLISITAELGLIAVATSVSILLSLKRLFGDRFNFSLLDAFAGW
jgi:type I restriction enzyme, S subunit